MSHLFVNLQNVHDNLAYVEKEDDYDLYPYFQRKRLIDKADENCKRLFGFVDGIQDENFGDNRKAVEEDVWVEI